MYHLNQILLLGKGGIVFFLCFLCLHTKAIVVVIDTANSTRSSPASEPTIIVIVMANDIWGNLVAVSCRMLVGAGTLIVLVGLTVGVLTVLVDLTVGILAMVEGMVGLLLTIMSDW